MTHTEIVKEKLKEIEKRNKAHREQAKRLKIAPLSDGGWDDTINLEGELKGMQTAIKSELEFLEKEKEFFDKLYYPQYLVQEIPHVVTTEKFFVDKSVEDDTFQQIEIIINRITDCKNALKLIKNQGGMK